MDNDILFASDPNWANETDGKLWRIEKGLHFPSKIIDLEKNRITVIREYLGPSPSVFFLEKNPDHHW